MLPERRLSRVLNHLFWKPTGDGNSDTIAPHPANGSYAMDDHYEPSLRSHPIPQLSALDTIADELRKLLPHDLDLSKVVIVGVQHNLETTVTLYKVLQKLGIRRIFTLGKCYSDSPEIVQSMKENHIHLIPSSKPHEPGQFHAVARQDIAKLWQTATAELKEDDVIIALDDGGRGLADTPPKIRLGDHKIAGVEQTRGGLYVDEIGRLPFPVVEVASSAVKRLIEPSFIAKAALRKVNDILANHKINKDTIIGVIGNGAIGGAIAEHLLKLGYRVAIYDESDTAFYKVKTHKHLYRMESIKDLITNSQCVFSCTGKDVTDGLALSNIVTKDTLFVSCTSEDREFLSALKTIARENAMTPDPLSDFTVRSKNGSKMIFARGGYPINFDGQPWNVPANEIEPTQAILFGGIIQAILSARKAVDDGLTTNRHERLMLSPEIQRLVIEKWRSTPAAKQYTESMLDCFKNIEWIQKNSGGEYRENALLKRIPYAKDDTATLPPPRSIKCNL